MANFKDFAVGLVVTPPSPATSGTSITLRAGDGLSMPAAPFYITATPPGQLTTLGTSEKLLVTAISGDTLTVTRAQGPTTAKSIAANWIIANALYSDDVLSSSITIQGTLTGTPNGVLTAFTVPQSFTSIAIYKNGVRLNSGSGNDYTISGTTITFATAPATGTVLLYDAIVGSQAMISGSNSTVSDETPAGTVNGVTVLFTAQRAYVAGSLQVFINGIKQKRTTHFTETNPALGTFTMSDAPLAGDDIMIAYQFVVSVSGNADTLDGEHLSSILSAIYPIGATFVSGSATMPTMIANIGTWVRLKGMVIVGVDEAQTEFDTINETGGAKTHTLTIAEMPAHNHGLNGAGTAGTFAEGIAFGNTVSPPYSNISAPMLNRGGGGAHNNLQPYKTKFMWERTA